MPARPTFVWLRRCIAAGVAALVLALTICAASPELHSKLHATHTIGHDDGCAVVLFANGVSMPTAIVAPQPPVAELREPQADVAISIFVPAPRYLRLPERGPPVLS